MQHGRRQIVEGKFQPAADKPEVKPGEAVDLARLGLVLVPDVLERTPPFVDVVRADSPAERAGVKPDALIVFLGEDLVQSCKSFREELAHVERDTRLKLVLLRGQDLVEVEIEPAAPAGESK